MRGSADATVEVQSLLESTVKSFRPVPSAYPADRRRADSQAAGDVPIDQAGVCL